LVFPNSTSLDEVAGLIDAIDTTAVRPIPNVEAVKNLQISQYLSTDIAVDMFISRFDDRTRIAHVLEERRRKMIQQ